MFECYRRISPEWKWRNLDQNNRRARMLQAANDTIVLKLRRFRLGEGTSDRIEDVVLGRWAGGFGVVDSRIRARAEVELG